MAGNQDPNDKSGNQDPNNWKTGLKDLGPEVLNHPSLESFKSVEDVIKSYVSVQPLIGREKIPLPRKDDKGRYLKEDLDIVFERLGRPKDEKGYLLPDVKLPDGFPTLDPVKLDQFRKKALEVGLMPQQAAELFKWYLDDTVGTYNAFQEDRTKTKQQAEADLRREWGKGFEPKLALAEKVINAYGDDSLKKLMQQEGLNLDPSMIKFLAKVGEKMSEDGMFGPRTDLMMTPDQADAEIKKIQGDKAHPYWNRQHPEHELAVQRMQQLFSIANPEDKHKE